MLARAAGAAGLLLALAGCWSAPLGPTSGSPVAPINANVTIKAIAQRYIDGDKFKRISEYFDGVENKGGQIIERSQPGDRTGYYFIVDLDWHPGVTLPKGTKAELQYIRSDTPSAQTANFTFSSDTGTWPEILLGLTGSDWPRADFGIVAYKLTFRTADGTVLADHESFLWALPRSIGTVPDNAADAAPTSETTAPKETTGIVTAPSAAASTATTPAVETPPAATTPPATKPSPASSAAAPSSPARPASVRGQAR